MPVIPHTISGAVALVRLVCRALLRPHAGHCRSRDRSGAGSLSGDASWIVSAGLIVTSIPTFLVLVSCQKIILRGITIPSVE